VADHVATGWPSFQPSELVTIRSMFFASFNWFQPDVTNRLLIPTLMALPPKMNTPPIRKHRFHIVM